MTEIEHVAEAIQAKCRERGWKECPAPLLHHVAGAAIDALDAFRNAQSEHCPTCGMTDERYQRNLTWAGCTDPWHADAHLRKPR